MRFLGAVIMVALVLGILLAPLAQASAGPRVVQVTFDSDGDAETSIAINPTNPKNVVAAWITDRGEPDQTCAFGVSFNGGRAWTIGRIPGVTDDDGGVFEIATDPSVAFDKFGSVYLTCLAFDNFPPAVGSPGTIFVSKSVDGGLTWGPPVAARTGITLRDFLDHQFITTNPATGAVYLTETEFRSFGKGEILFIQSLNGGASYLSPVQVNDFSEGAWFQDSFSAAKDANTVYVTYGAGSSLGISDWDQIFIAKSTNGGTTFASAKKLTNIIPLPSPLPNGQWRVGNTLWIAVQPVTGTIYLAYADYRNGDADIWLLRVQDTPSGFVVLGEIRVNDDPVGNGADQFFPFLTVAPNGRIDVCFQDRRYEPGDALIFTTCALSSDGGLTFTNVQVTTDGYDPGNTGFIGDYNWQASTENLVMPIFVGGAPGRLGQEILVARVPS